MTIGNESLDPRRIATAPIAGLNATKLFLQYQASMLRMWANNCELAAHNFERGLDTFKPAREQRREGAGGLHPFNGPSLAASQHGVSILSYEAISPSTDCWSIAAASVPRTCLY